jgi:subtilase family serine protease
MKQTALAATLMCAAMLPAALTAASAQTMTTFNGLSVLPGKIIPGRGQVLTPASSLEAPGDIGRRAHTHYKIFASDAKLDNNVSTLQLVSNSPDANTPASVACIYGLVRQTHGCDPRVVLKTARGGSQVIAIVDAFHNPTALADLQRFSTDLGLPAPRLEVVFCTSSTDPTPRCATNVTPPSIDQGWAGEIALDVQWAHAMAPRAKIILVEAFSSSFNNLLMAEDAAARLVARAGGGEVSNSWGGSEFSQQTGFDSHFSRKGVVFFASTGDHKCSGGGDQCPDVNWPSTSPNVVGVGGTSITRSAKGAYRTQSSWIDGGGGLSSVYSRPKFQNAVKGRVGTARGVPDVSALADPETGAFVFCSAGTCGSSGGYFLFGGTSLASPIVAALTNAAGTFRQSSNAQNTFQYPELGSASFLDVKTGQCINGPGGTQVNALAGWDVCSGIGAPVDLSGF